MTPQTVLITGASSGIGKAAARYFAAQGWKVAATMRSPHKETELNQLPQVKLFALDVTDPASIAQAIADVRKAFGRIDALVNNAGYGADGVFEAMSDDVIRSQFDTNVFGLMRMTRAIIPVMREQGGGVILQVSSMGGRLTFPLFSIYHGTKWAVEGFSESLHYELSPFGIRVKLIEPGSIRTDFMGRSRVEVKPDQLPEYQAFVDQCNRVSEGAGHAGDSPEVVAKTIFRAASDGSRRMRYATGSPAPLLLWLRKRIPDSWWFAIVRSTYKI